ncbi:hypothetical protein [Bacillus solimangrovi]|uniref:Uncharacterized protein n=1 Tax=Bacillus solimangrovi TaxID=1305675 RepID=A0A1E5LI49_9BACI|nr:hypothetical protein [Bacillus solimangrovi]OEH93762.1 hypothetical protein BFG57_11290 [Bacillus solimangrovi]
MRKFVLIMTLISCLLVFNVTSTYAKNEDLRLNIVDEDTKRGDIQSAKAYTLVFENDDKVGVQYSLFYPYNDAMDGAVGQGAHEGDWERIRVIADKDTEEIESMYYAAHSNEGQWYDNPFTFSENIKSFERSDYDTGQYPAVAVTDDGMVIEVHENEVSGGNLYYNLGQIVDDEVEWLRTGVKYDTGQNPTVAVTNSGKVIEIHENEVTGGSLYYNVGTIDGDRINWTKNGTYYDSGQNPSITVAGDGTIIEIHENEFTGGNLYYSLGKVDGNKINWFTKGKKYDTGHYPSVTATNGTIVEMHEASGNLYYNVGTLNGSRIDWTSSGTFYDTGHYPDVTVTQDGKIFEVHEGDDRFYYNIGQLNGKKITWSKWNGSKSVGTPLDFGSQPSVQFSPTNEVVVVNESDSGYQMDSRIVTLLDEYRPVGFSAKISHASYPRVASYSRIPLPSDVTDRGTIWDLQNNVSLIGSDYKTNDSYRWVAYDGLWGNTYEDDLIGTKSPSFGIGNGWFKDKTGSTDPIDVVVSDYDRAMYYAEKFAPIMYMHSEDIDHPSTVEWFLERVQLIYKGEVILDVGEVNPSSLVDVILE